MYLIVMLIESQIQDKYRICALMPKKLLFLEPPESGSSSKFAVSASDPVQLDFDFETYCVGLNWMRLHAFPLIVKDKNWIMRPIYYSEMNHFYHDNDNMTCK